MINNYKQFLNEGSINTLRYSIFDWDDNILMMDTKIHAKDANTGEDKLISTKKLVELKEEYDKYWDNEEYKMDFGEAFLEFRDFGPRGKNAFINDVIESIDKNKYGPSWDNFIKTLVNGNLFGIVTTRGHESETIRMAVEYIIYNELDDDQQDKMVYNLMKYHEKFDKSIDYLVDDYLQNCFFIGVMSEHFKNLFGYDPSRNPNKGKQDAVRYIVGEFSEYGKKINTPTKIGFSDDDPGYANAVKSTFIRNKELFDNINFYIFDTSNEEDIRKEKI